MHHPRYDLGLSLFAMSLHVLAIKKKKKNTQQYECLRESNACLCYHITLAEVHNNFGKIKNIPFVEWTIMI